MGTHPIFESDFDCLTECIFSSPVGLDLFGKNLVQNLRLNGHKVTIVSRFKGADDTITWQQLRFGQAPEDATALVNLAGNQWARWNTLLDRNLLDVSNTSAMEKFTTSRLSTAEVCRAYALEREASGNKLDVFIQSSAYWYYHSNEETQEYIYSEYDKGGHQGLFSRQTRQWEDCATLPAEAETRQVVIRTGQVLHPDGGIMRRFTTHRGYLGDGFNPLNWIHIDDMIGLITFALINNHVNGVLNGVAPNLVNHQDLAKEMKLGRSWITESRGHKWYGQPTYSH